MFEPLNLELFGTTLAGFFAIMNPLANTPIFLGLTNGLSAIERRAVASKATLVAFLVVVIFALLGQLIFTVFGITSAAFRLAGGIVVFLIGYRMLQGEHSSLHQTKRAKQAAETGVRQARESIVASAARTSAPAVPQDSSEDSSEAPESEASESELSVAITPLGVPLLAGPGTIATAVGFSAGHWEHALVAIVAFAVLCFATWVSFVAGERLVGLMGQSALKVITRLMGLILAVIGVEMFLHGLQEAGY